MRFLLGDTDLGRLPLDLCRWVAPLLDCNAIKLHGTCVYAPSVLTPTEPVVLSLTVLANHSWFSRPPQTFGGKQLRGQRQAGSSSSSSSAEGSQQPTTTCADAPALDAVTLDRTGGDAQDVLDDTKASLRLAIRACFAAVGIDATPQFHTATNSSTTTTMQGGPEAREDSEENSGARDLEYVCERMGQVDATLKEADPPKGAMTCTLRPYQKQALGWMMEREELTRSSTKNRDQLHPMYTKLAFPDSTPLYWSDTLCVLTTAFPSASEQFRGGILADAMVGPDGWCDYFCCGGHKHICMHTHIHTHTCTHTCACTRAPRPPKYLPKTALRPPQTAPRPP